MGRITFMCLSSRLFDDVPAVAQPGLWYWLLYLFVIFVEVKVAPRATWIVFLCHLGLFMGVLYLEDGPVTSRNGNKKSRKFPVPGGFLNKAHQFSMSTEAAEKRFIRLPSESIRLCAERVGIQTSAEVSTALVEDVSFRIRQITDVSTLDPHQI